MIRVGTVDLQRFIEGCTLGELHGSGAPIPASVVAQIFDLVHQMASVEMGAISAERKCVADDRSQEGDTQSFLERLIHFTENRVFHENAKQFERLFRQLGVDGDAFGRLRDRTAGLTQRPFCLLHADLHRENFIVDAQGRLWTIDWELAMIGDPLYDLATHLHLMRYPKRQEGAVVRGWLRTVEDARPGASTGWAADLPKLLEYKRAQSVFTDVIRESLSLDTPLERDARHAYRRAANKVREVLVAAAAPLGLDTVPSTQEISSALASWYREHKELGRSRVE